MDGEKGGREREKEKERERERERERVSITFIDSSRPCFH